MDDDHRDDRGFQRFFCYLNLFTFSMLVLVLADNLRADVPRLGGRRPLLLSADRLLVQRPLATPTAAAKAFIVNRIGDFGFLIGIFLLFASLVSARRAAGVGFAEISQNFAAIAERHDRDAAGARPWRLVDVIGLCFFVGAAGKSAQIPLYVWLPDAMAGPTPVSRADPRRHDGDAPASTWSAGSSFLYAAAPRRDAR